MTTRLPQLFAVLKEEGKRINRAVRLEYRMPTLLLVLCVTLDQAPLCKLEAMPTLWDSFEV